MDPDPTPAVEAASPVVTDPTLQLIAESYGLPGMVLFLSVALLGFLSVGLPRLITALRPPQRMKNTPEPPSARRETPTPSKTWWEGVSASMIKAEKSKQDETQDERLNRIDARIDEVFSVEGKHRQELLGIIKDLREEVKRLDDKLEKERDKNDRKNEQQDRTISGLSTSFATLQGMVAMRQREGGSGVTMFTPEKKKEEGD
jgi:hypothetical protein